MVVLRHRVCPATTIPVSEDGPSRGVAPVLVDPGALPRFHPLYPSRAPTPMLDRPGGSPGIRKGGAPTPMLDRPGPGPGTGKEGLLGLRPSSKHITLQYYVFTESQRRPKGWRADGASGPVARFRDRRSTSSRNLRRNSWFRSWRRPSGLPAVGGLTGATPRTSCGGQPSELLVLFVTEFKRSPKCLRDALLSFELEEIRHGLREHGHELEHCGHGPKIIVEWRAVARSRRSSVL